VLGDDYTSGAKRSFMRRAFSLRGGTTWRVDVEDSDGVAYALAGHERLRILSKTVAKK
jgi:hypothetical protein